jgi:phosphoribosylamine---glycine ligase
MIGSSRETPGGGPKSAGPDADGAMGGGVEVPVVKTVCVVGSGGREHALAVVLGRTADVVVAPGNPGIAGRTAEGHTITSVATSPEEIQADLFVIGPEAPLVDGLADRLRARGHLVFGPGADGARLEGSKAFMKEMLAEAGVPTARFGVFSDPVPANAYLRTLGAPWVIKTDGLAAGKGVLVTDSLSEAEADIESKLSGEAFGEAGRRVVVEEGLTGPECSLLVLCDGERLVPLAPAQDFKRLRDFDRGPNTGGMGAYSPVPFVDAPLVDRLVDEAVAPLVAAMRACGIDYRGVLYAGLMLTPEGPKVLEFNVRFGDPEAQVVLPRLDGNLTGLLAQAAAGALTTVPRFLPSPAVCVVLASEGYPEAPRTGDVIGGLGAAASVAGVTVFHAGTAFADGSHASIGSDVAGGTDSSPGRDQLTQTRPVRTAGGRVLGVTALGATVDEARDRAYRGVSAIRWPGMQVRTDIALTAAGVAEPDLHRRPGTASPGSVPSGPAVEHEALR